MLNIVINLFGGQAYEITDRHTAPRSSSANRYRSDPWYTGSLIRQLPLEPHDWLRVMEKVRRRPLEIFSNHPAEVYDAVTEAVMRGELAIYKLPQLDAIYSVRGNNAKNTGLCFVRGPDAHCATELTPEPVATTETAKALLDELGISEKLFLRELAHKGLYNSYQQRDPMQTALKMLASGEILAYKIPMPPMAKPPKPVEYEDTSGPKFQPVPLGPEASAAPEAKEAPVFKRDHKDGHVKDPYTLQDDGKPLGAKEGIMPIEAKGLDKPPRDHKSLLEDGYPDVVARNDYQNFSDIKPTHLPPGTKIYRIIDEGSSEANGKSGCYWAYSKPANKTEWRSNYAVKDSWNDNGYYVEHTVGKEGLKVWEGKVAGQEYLEHKEKQFYLEGGETQLYVSFNTLGKLSPKPTNWPEA